MKDINISITKTKIKGVNISFNEDSLPTIAVTLGLYTEDQTQITEYCISTDHWTDEKKFAAPFNLIKQVIAISEVLEEVVTKHCQASCKLIGE